MTDEHNADCHNDNDANNYNDHINDHKSEIINTTLVVAEATRLRKLGYNIIPIHPESKMPIAKSGEILQWRKNGCKAEIKPEYNIAMLHGGIGGTWAVDMDDPSILADLMINRENIKQMCVVKTPKQGHHVLFRTDDDDLPVGDVKFADHNNRKIDIKSVGYTLIPPSLHPEKHLGRYAYLHNNNITIRMKWQNMLYVLHENGFFTAAEQDEIRMDIASTTTALAFGNNTGEASKYEYNALLRGGFRPGERRRKQRSLYIRKRIMGSTQADAQSAIRKVNSTCNPPLPESEIRHNMKSAEKWYMAHKQEFEQQQSTPKHFHNNNHNNSVNTSENNFPAGSMSVSSTSTGQKTRRSINIHNCADIITTETQYITHPSGELYFYSDGIWMPGGEKILQQSCESRWREYNITSGDIHEIEEIVRIRSLVLPTEIRRGDEIFNLDESKIVLENGTFDLQSMQLVEHSPDHKATVRHPITYDATKECLVFEKCLGEWFDEEDEDDNKKTDEQIENENDNKTSEEKVDGNKSSKHKPIIKKYRTIILEMFALAFIRKRIVQKGYVNYGKGSNGKSTCMEILRSMLGEQNTTSVEMQSFENNRFIGDVMHDKCANISSDGGTQPLIKTGLIKSVLGGDSITCEPKFKRPFVYSPFCSLIFTFNELPVVIDSSDGFARKIQLIPWQKKFQTRNPQVNKLKNNTEEQSGIFNLLVPVMKRLLETEQLQYEDTAKTTQEMWMRRSDSFFMFRDQYLVFDSKYEIEVNKIRNLYTEACEEHGMTPVGRNEFHTRMSELMNGAKAVPSRKSDPNGAVKRVWKNVTVRSELRPEGQDALDGGKGN